MEPRLHPTTFAEPGRGPVRQRQPPATSRGFTGQGPDEPKLLPAGSTVSAFAGGGLAPGRPCGLPGLSATPTRSARTPLVMGPRPRRLESPAWPAPLRSGSDADDDPTARAPPPRRVGSRGPSTTRLREAACAALRARLATCPKSRRRDVSLARTHPGPGPLSPCLREEARGPLHPRCLPSVNRHRRPRRSRSLAEDDPSGTSRPMAWDFSTDCYQPVEKTRRLLRNLAGSTALDGAMGRRSSGARGGSTAPASCPGAYRGRRAEARRPRQAHTGRLHRFLRLDDPRRDEPENLVGLAVDSAFETTGRKQPPAHTLPLPRSQIGHQDDLRQAHPFAFILLQPSNLDPALSTVPLVEDALVENAGRHGLKIKSRKHLYQL